MIKIQPIQINYPPVEVNAIKIRVLPFQTTDTSCGTYYELISQTEVTVNDEIVVNSKTVADGNYQLTDDEFTNWGADNSFIEDVVLNFLNLERLVEINS